ncbi:MAG TPA: hypothetical protein VGM88_05735 [Kofleriaceae bacterium]|jgi:uncharacterized protein (DUF3084 family)
MRLVRLVYAIVVAAALSGGCKSHDSDAASTAAPPPDPAAVRAQQEMMKRRDSLLAQRAQVAEQIKQIAAGGGDTSALLKQRDDIQTQLDSSSQEVIDSLATLKQTIAAAGDVQSNMASREANMGTREKTVAGREATIAEREKQIATREAALAEREKNTCGAAMPPVIVQTVVPTKAGGRYERKDVEPLLARARATMAKKGILAGDLGAAAGLETESTTAMADNDWGKAYLAAAQLSATVDAIKVDRAFIISKYGRLNARVSGAKVDDATSAQLTDGMKEVMQKYGDGDFAAANRKLNQLAAVVK